MRIGIVDGNYLIFRSYYSTINWFWNKKRNAIYGFEKTLDSLKKNFDINRYLILFDKPGKNFRKELMESYKSSRPKPPESLLLQLLKMKKRLESIGIKVIEKAGVEADDLIGIATNKLEKNNKITKLLIISADKDLNQLITKKTIRLYYKNKKWRKMTDEEVKKQFGIYPNQFADYLAIIGDTADDIPKGIEGYGPKKASKLLNKYNNIETIIKQPQFKSLKDRLVLNKKLTTILRN